jgi:hypothetical protein
MSKTSTASIERELDSALFGYKDRAAAVKAAHASARQAIKDDPMTSDLAKREKLADLGTQTRTKLDGLKADQESFIKGLRDKVERELRGSQPADANSVLLRRDASDRARKLNDKDEALAVLQDAISNGDSEMAHAVGSRARNTGMVGVAEAYKAAFPETAESAGALAFIEGVSQDIAYNVANSITYSAPTD